MTPAGPRLGCHVSVAGGLSQAIPKAVDRGCETIQIFTTSPRMWAHQRHPDEEVLKFREGLAGHGIGPVVVHASYLINLASPDPALRKKSASLLADTARWTAAIGGATVIVHTGRATGGGPMDAALDRATAELRGVLAQLPAGVTLSLEISSGGRGSVGAVPDHFKTILDGLAGDPRVRVWLDTAHAFEAGWDLREAEGADRLAADLARTVGLDRIAGAHVNDSKTPLGSTRDRHENLGEGELGERGLRRFLTHPAFRALPHVLETPGFDGLGPDRENMERLRRLASGA